MKIVVYLAIVLAAGALVVVLFFGVGEKGDQGTAGTAGTAVCSTCHDGNTALLAKQLQAAASVHSTGDTYQRNHADCAVCHTSEGFLLSLAAGSWDIGTADIVDPTPPNCRTCHQVHTAYTAADWALTTSAPVTLALTEDTIDLGNGNLCANCHQPRDTEPVPTVGGADVVITSTRYGPHHGPQSSVVAGVGGYGAFTGSNVHYTTVTEGCVTCHMAAAPSGGSAMAGSHTLNMEYEYHSATEENLTGCETCHTGITAFDRNSVQTDIQAKIDTLKAKLITAGLLNSSGSSGVAGTFTSAQAGALWNYKTVTEDRSIGIHNPQYVEFLLDTGIAALP